MSQPGPSIRALLDVIVRPAQQGWAALGLAYLQDLAYCHVGARQPQPGGLLGQQAQAMDNPGCGRVGDTGGSSPGHAGRDPWCEAGWYGAGWDDEEALCARDGCGAVAVTESAQADRPALGILAGGGPLPGRVAAAAAATGRPVFVVGLEGYAEPMVLAPWPHQVIRMGAVGSIFNALRGHGCQDLVLIGTVRRPSLLHLRPDAEGSRMALRIGRAAFAGDDGLLAAVIKVLGEEGFRVLGAHEILREALAPTGLLGRVAPDAQAMGDIARGVAVTRALGGVDVGQGCVVQQGLVLAVEAAEGTDAMLARCGDLARPGPAGVLVKLVKPGQERRADLPTVGVHTVRGAAAAGLRGIAFEAGGTLLADREVAVAEADAAGIFLLGLDPDSLLEGRDST